LVKLFLVDLSFGCEDVKILMNLRWRWKSYVMIWGGLGELSTSQVQGGYSLMNNETFKAN
jgi:hypothetical protein